MYLKTLAFRERTRNGKASSSRKRLGVKEDRAQGIRMRVQMAKFLFVFCFALFYLSEQK